MGKPFSGSINLSLLLKAAKNQHSAFVKAGKNKHIFVNVTLWENDRADEFGNEMSLQVNPMKDSKDDNKEGRFYIGNFKPNKAKTPEALTGSEDGLDESEFTIRDKTADDEPPF